MVNKFVLNADDFGMSTAINRAVEEGFDGGILKSVSVCANGDCFEDAMNTILPKCEGLGIGIHLNITEGKSICTDLTKLTDSNMKFNNSFFKLLIKSYNPKDKVFLEEVEREFRRQIEKVMAKTKVSHIDSHSHIHSIPPIFEIVCRLAKEYKIEKVRTCFEKSYLVPDLFRHLSKKYVKNHMKSSLLNFLAVFNENTIYKNELKTNDYIIGIRYADSMDSMAIAYGLKAIRNNNVTVETVIHPSRYDDGTINNRFDEYMITKNQKLKHKIEKMGYEITNYVKEET